MKLSDIKGEDALDVLADLIDPAAKIMDNKKVEQAYRGAPRLEFIKVLLKECKKEVIEIMAILDQTPVEDYEINIISIPAKVKELLDDPVMSELFRSQGQTETSSGSATENIEVEEK